MDKDLFDERLLYYGLDEFVKNRRIIKEVFWEQDLKTQYIYKLYMYSRAFISDTWKDNMWDYLQNDIDEFTFISIYHGHKK